MDDAQILRNQLTRAVEKSDLIRCTGIMNLFRKFFNCEKHSGLNLLCIGGE